MSEAIRKTARLVSGGQRGVNWHKSTSPSGHIIAEVISAVVKEMRHGKEEPALAWAIDMARSGHEAEEFLWECLSVFCVEDIGLADPDALVRCAAAQELYFALPRGTGRRLTVLSYAICLLSRAKKTRYQSELMLELVASIEEGTHRFSMPDRALDFHVGRGKRKGRGQLHYLTEAASLRQEDKSFPRHYRQALVRRARKAEK